MAKTGTPSIAHKFLTDTLVLVGGSVWGWMILDALKPGLISYSWNLLYHWIALIALLILWLAHERYCPTPINVTPHKPSRLGMIVWGLMGGMSVWAFLRDWGGAGVILGFSILVIIYCSLQELSYEEPHRDEKHAH